MRSPTQPEPLFTPNEAAVLTHLPLKTVQNAIDKKIVAAAGGQRAGHVTRLLDLRALTVLMLEQRLADRFPRDLRRQIFDAMARSTRDAVALEDGLLTIDLRQPRRELAGSLRTLRRARELVTVDREVMGGDPVFRGTRVPVHMIAELVSRGTPEAELLEDYPRVTSEMVRLAPTYAAAYPLRGRPRARSWRERPPVRVTRRPLSDFKVA